MDLGLFGKRALVTGATRGIGRAIAETLLAEGAAVAICARNENEVQNATAELSNAGRVFGSAVDVSDVVALEAWIAESAAALGGVDVYVHNTSAKPQKDLGNWVKNFEVDLRALVAGVAASRVALADGGGSLISIGTTAVSEHFASGSGSYSALKAAVTNWTLGQAQVLGAKGIRCNVVSPGPIWVDGGDWDAVRSANLEFFDATRQKHPMGELGSVSDVAAVVAFLAGDVSCHVNGVNITVDGGFLKRVNY
jgi:NAD(P)-dependent dehydrogenase (short-subunit alcohol dehydrogenase family)